MQCLCTTLKIPVDSCNEVMAEEKYVVTLDFVLKMLNINERKQCSIPVVIEGETGVGKTALVEILSKLWNLSHRKWIEDEQQAFHSYLKERLEGQISYTELQSTSQLCHKYNIIGASK